ncbi:TPA: hypothetical protein ACKPZ6_004838 [Serratia liquefaciens]
MDITTDGFKNAFYGKVQRVIPVSTVNDSNLMLFGIRFVPRADIVNVLYNSMVTYIANLACRF